MFKYSGSRPLNQSLQYCGSVLELDGEKKAGLSVQGSVRCRGGPPRFRTVSFSSSIVWSSHRSKKAEGPLSSE